MARHTERLDVVLVARGLAQSRERARALVLAGQVRVNGVVVSKAGTPIPTDAGITLDQPDHPWVGRGGIKLAHALDVFGIDPAGVTALDLGASTGGFTDVLLQRGAARVVALDVGHNQLDWRIRNDSRVVVIEGVNARYLRPEDLPPRLCPFDLVTIDVSFISLRHILPVVPALLAPAPALSPSKGPALSQSKGGRVIALVKPQFEAGRDEVGDGGIVRDAAVHARVLDEITRAAAEAGLARVGIEASPVTGAEGNREFLLLFRHAVTPPAAV